MTMNKKLNLDEIEARANAATPGEWRRCKHNSSQVEKVSGCSDAHNVVYVANDGDASFIAHARTDIPALIAEVRRLQTCDRGRFVCDAEIARLETDLRAAREALWIAAERLEGVSLAIEKHGQDITPSFFIVEYQKYATEARKALSSSVGSDGEGEE